jgi:hypothetical protein
LAESGNTATALASGMRTTQVLRVPFESLMATHRGARRRLQLALWALLLVGLGLVALGLFGVLPLLPAVVVGVVTAAVAVIPYREMVERDERIEGLEVLREEWRGRASASATPQQDSERFIELLWKLYGRQ